jgi:hypothetical protein
MNKSIIFLKSFALYLLCLLYLLLVVEFSWGFSSIFPFFEFNFYTTLLFALFFSVWIFYLNLKINRKFVAVVFIAQVVSLAIVPGGYFYPIGLESLYFVSSFLCLYVLSICLNKTFDKVLINKKLSNVLIIICVPLFVYLFYLTVNEYYTYKNEKIFLTEANDYPYKNAIEYISKESVYLQNCSKYLMPFRKEACEYLVNRSVEQLGKVVEKREDFELKYKDLLQNPINKGVGIDDVFAGGFTLCNGIPERFGDYIMEYSSVRNHESNTIREVILTDEKINIRYSNGVDWESSIEVELYRSSPNNKANPYYHDYDLFEKEKNGSFPVYKEKREFNSIFVLGHDPKYQKYVEEIGKAIIDICEKQPVMIIREEDMMPDKEHESWWKRTKYIY